MKIQLERSWAKCSGQSLYLRDLKENHYCIILLHSEGILRWHAPLAHNDYRLLVLAPLEEEWNDVRVIANRVTGRADVYLNDLDTPLAMDLPFQRPVVSWGDVALQIVHEARAGESRDALYGEIVVTEMK